MSETDTEAEGRKPKTSKLAIASILIPTITTCVVPCSWIVLFTKAEGFWLTWPVGLILGIVALVVIKKSKGLLKGRGFAIAGVVTSACFICGFTLFIAVGRFITGEKPIHRAAEKGNLKRVKKIIGDDPTQINIQDNLGMTPLYVASIKGHTEVVEFLLAHNADIELGNNQGERPLAKASKFGHYKTVKTLLEHGATVNCKDVFGQTPLHEGARGGNKDMVDILISYGADIFAKNNYGITPLHHAAMRNNIEAAKALVEHGADIFEKDNKNQTPKDVALQRGLKELAQYLQTKEEEKGAGIK